MGKYVIENLRLADIVVVRSLSDLPAPVGGVITLEEKEYILDNEISSPYPLAFPGTDIRATMRAVNRQSWIYTGTEACFKDLDARGFIELFGLMQFEAPNGIMLDLATSGGYASMQCQGGTRFTNMQGIGHLKGPDLDWNIFFGTISGFDTGFDIEDIGFFEVNTNFVFGNDTTTTDYFHVHGPNTTGPVNFELISTAPGVNETLFNLDRNIRGSVDSVLIQSVQQFGDLQGSIFAPTSLTQVDPIVTAQGNAEFPDSTIKAKLAIADNSTVTTISAIDTPTPIQGTWADGTIEERLCFSDRCTFDNTTNTITTVDLSDVAFTHLLSNGDIIEFIEDGGLPTGLSPGTEYFIVNVTANTFQVSLTSGGSVVPFTTDGTPLNYYCHNTGSSKTGWVIYTGLQDTSLVVQGWVAIDKSGAAANAGTHLYKTDTSFVETSQARGSKVTVNQGNGQSSMISDIVNLSTGEGVKIYIENRENSDDLTVTDSDITFNRA